MIEKDGALQIAKLLKNL